MPGYEYVLHRGALLGALACADPQMVRLFQAIELLTEDATRRADLYGQDSEGRLMSWMKVGDYAVGYAADHSRKLIQILDIRQVAD